MGARGSWSPKRVPSGITRPGYVIGGPRHILVHCHPFRTLPRTYPVPRYRSEPRAWFLKRGAARRFRLGNSLRICDLSASFCAVQVAVRISKRVGGALRERWNDRVGRNVLNLLSTVSKSVLGRICPFSGSRD